MDKPTNAPHRMEEELALMRTNLEEEFKSRLAELSAEWHGERERLTAELAHRIQTATQWELERARLNAEIDRLTRAQLAAQMEAERAISAMKAASKSIPVASLTIQSEIHRVE